MIENAAAVLRDIEVGKSVAIVVADGHALAVAAGSDAGFFGYIGERSVAIVSIESVAQRRIGIVKIAFAAVDQINVHPSVVVVVEKSAACAGGLGQIFLRRLARGVFPGDATRRGRNFLEGIKRSRAMREQDATSRENEPLAIEHIPAEICGEEMRSWMWKREARSSLRCFSTGTSVLDFLLRFGLGFSRGSLPRQLLVEWQTRASPSSLRPVRVYAMASK